MSDYNRTVGQPELSADRTFRFPTREQRVFVIDDHTLGRESVTALAHSMGLTAVAFESAEEFLAQVSPDQPGCVVTDLRLRGMSGLELLDRLALGGYSIPVILVTGFAKTHITVQAVKMGAVTVLEKPYDNEDLWNAVRSGFRQDHEARDLRQRHHKLETRFDKLTAHEQEVLDLIVDGRTNRQIAHTLHVSTRTIESRRHNIFEKTEAKTIADLVRMTLMVRRAERLEF